MHDTHLILDGVPELSASAFDREVAVVHVWDPNDLLAEVEVEEALVRVTVSVVVPVDVGQHVFEDCGIWFDCQHARVEPDRESSVIQIHVRAGGEDEGKVEELVESSFHESVCVQIHDRPE